MSDAIPRFVYVEAPELVRKRELEPFRNHPDSRRLLEQVDRLCGSFPVERSFKFLPGKLLCDRFIVTVPFDRPGTETVQETLGILKALSMPKAQYALFVSRMSRASKIHFGFEGDGSRSLFKVYLEFFLNDCVKLPASWVLLLGFKWDPSNPDRQAVSRYEGLPSYTPGAVNDMIKTFFVEDHYRSLRGIVQAMLLACDRRAPHLRMWYLDVAEDGNPRHSFDFKTYRAGLPLDSIMPLLPELCRYYHIPFREYAPYFSAIRQHKFGHVSCGKGRDDVFFVAIYHQAQGQ
jgi:hypothetical protein